MLKYNNLIGLALLLCCFCIMSTSSIKLNERRGLDMQRKELLFNPKTNGTAKTTPIKKAVIDPLLQRRPNAFY